MMKMWRKLLVMGMFIFTSVWTTGCGRDKETELAEVHIAYFNNVTHAQALLMKSEQSLENSLGDDIKVKWTAFNAGPAEVEALFAGAIDIGYIGPVPAVNANVKSKGDVEIISGATKGGAVLITGKDSGIRNVADLSGKNVAIPQIGNTQHLCLLHLLKENGLAPVTEGGNVTISAIVNADVANAMERGDIDAAIVPEPWGTTLLEQGAELLLDYDQIYMNGQYDVAVVVVRKEFMEENPEIVEQFLKEHEAVTGKLTENKDEAIKIINAELERATGKALSDSIIKQAFERIGVSGELNKDSIMGLAQISKEQKIISEIPKESALFIQ